jgi:hypothetical protein
MSNLTRNEVLEIAEDLIFGSLGKELGEMLRDASMLIQDSPSEPNYAYDAPTPPDEVSVATELVRQRKMSRKALIQLITSVAPRLPKAGLPEGSSHEVLRWFFEHSTTLQWSKLFHSLITETTDPYLKGIVRRNR